VDDKYAINAAKTEYREGMNTGDIDRVLSAFAPFFIDMSEGQPSFFGPDAPAALRKRLKSLFSEYVVRLMPLVSTITLFGERATVWGWHKIWLTPKHGGETSYLKLRYFETWEKQKDGTWKIDFVMSNRDEGQKMEPYPEKDALAISA
jgi:ketosteroid isomerase-like protein